VSLPVSQSHFVRIVLISIPRWLSGIKIIDMTSLTEAIKALHTNFRTPHILITSVSLPCEGATPSLSVIGSTITSTAKPRIFEIKVPSLDCYFSGTGDMFGALMVVRLREAVNAVEGLSTTDAWVSGDEVAAVDLPLAKAAEKALASMQELLVRTKKKRDEDVAKMGEVKEGMEKIAHIRRTRAAEVHLVRNLDCLRNPTVLYTAEKVSFEE
jgi:pyridoxine kinase